MAGFEVVFEGMQGLRRALRAAASGVPKGIGDEFEAGVGPVVADIRGRFAALGGTGRRTAQTVSGSSSPNRIELSMGGRGAPGTGYELGREFGAKGEKTSTYTMRTPAGPVRVTRTIDYSNPRIFGRWTGNQFTLDGMSGNAFHPGIRDHYDVLVDSVDRVVDRAVDNIAKAGV